MTTVTDSDSGRATRAVVEFILGAELADMPEDVVRVGKRCLIDGIGVVLAGSTADCSRIVRDQLRRIAGAGEATVIGHESFKAPTFLAARANGTAGHALDYDDTQLSRYPDRIFGLLTHPTIPPLASGLAVAEASGASGAAFLEAFLVGFEVECKVAEAIHPEHYRRGFHSSGTIGAFGAVACAAKLMGLGADELELALGLTASLTGGIRLGFGTMAKPLHVGRAAENGVSAAELAASGFTAGRAAFDSPWGFFHVMGGGFDEEKLVGALGEPWAIVDPGVSVKPYPCGSLSHPSLDALLDVVEGHQLEPDDIARIVLRAGNNILKPLRYPRPGNALEAKFSLPFLLSSIAIRRRAGIREFTDDFVASEPVRAMMRRVELVHDAEIERHGFEKMRSVVEVHLEDGRSFTREASVYRGGPERPLTREELHGKFAECAEAVLGDEGAREALNAIESVEGLGSLRSLMEVLA